MNKLRVDLFCIASGPSLTKEDCKLVASTGVKILAVNNSWELTPRCNFLFAGDLKWWDAYATKVPAKIIKFTSSKKAAVKHRVNFFPASGPFNSGMRAIMWALRNGFKNIVLLGFDCSLKNDIHWHGAHDIKLGLSNPDAARVKKWHTHFLDVRAHSERVGANILNCSRYTELGCFSLASLESVLGLKERIESKEIRETKEEKRIIKKKGKKSSTKKEK